MIQFFIIFFIVTFLLFGVGITHFLERKNWLPNRYITGSLVFFIVLVPSILVPNLPLVIKYLLYGMSALLAIVFFETSRRLLESGRYKGIVTPTLDKKEKE